MDARQNFYNHNRLLFRFLVLATLVFVAIVGLVTWQEAHRILPTVESPSLLRHFSTEAAVAEGTRNYAYGAKHIHDLEAYSNLVEVFFAPTLRTELGETTLEKRLSEVAEAKVNATQFGSEHVYHTSYYVGNLLVLPNLSLHELLTTAVLPNTAILLETALADLRAGAVKIQNHYDVAPPTWYKEVASTSPLFYPTPSFPSLTMSESAIVFYILATVDPGQARIYEHQAKVFASQMFTSGAHFRLDIEYAILLANEYIKIMRDLPPYLELFSKAAAEWPTNKVTVGEVGLDNIPYDFTFPGFPTLSKFSITSEGEMAYEEMSQIEEPTGSIKLTLLDTRLPEPALKLYEYNLAGPSQVLPYALDLTARQFPGLQSSLGYSRHLEADKYLFLSGTVVEQVMGEYRLASSSLFWRDKEVTKLIEPDQLTASIAEPVLSSSGDEFLFVSRDSSGRSSIMLSKLIPRIEQEPSLVTMGYSPSYAGHQMLTYLRDGISYIYNLETMSESALLQIPPLTSRGRLQFVRELQMLVVTDQTVNTVTLVPESTIRFYSLAATMPELRYTLKLTDANVSSVVPSPGGNYLAIALTKGWGGHEGAVLLYDIKSGIISEEIDLSPFAPAPIELDGWTLF